MRVSREDFEATKFLGGVVGAKNPFLKRIAMMNQEERELISYLECVKIFMKQSKMIDALDQKGELENKDLKEFISKVMAPIIEKIGLGKYKMGEISHLAMKIGSTRKSYKGNFPEI